MSVQTLADDYIDSAREAVRKADVALQQAVLEVCANGYGNDISDDFKRRLRAAAFKMQEVREAIE